MLISSGHRSLSLRVKLNAVISPERSPQTRPSAFRVFHVSSSILLAIAAISVASVSDNTH